VEKLLVDGLPADSPRHLLRFPKSAQRENRDLCGRSVARTQGTDRPVILIKPFNLFSLHFRISSILTFLDKAEQEIDRSPCGMGNPRNQTTPQNVTPFLAAQKVVKHL
jgi:hypothetical protein